MKDFLHILLFCPPPKLPFSSPNISLDTCPPPVKKLRLCRVGGFYGESRFAELPMSNLCRNVCCKRMTYTNHNVHDLHIVFMQKHIGLSNMYIYYSYIIRICIHCMYVLLCFVLCIYISIKMYMYM